MIHCFNCLTSRSRRTSPARPSARAMPWLKSAPIISSPVSPGKSCPLGSTQRSKGNEERDRETRRESRKHERRKTRNKTKIRKAGKQEKQKMSFSCFPAFLIGLGFG